MIDKRLMYAQGRRVGFQGGGRDASQDDFGSEDVSGKGDNDRPNMADIAGPVTAPSTKTETKPDAKDNYISTMYSNMPTPTVTIGETPRGPITIKTTYTDKRNRQNILDALNAKGISSFDPRVTKLGISPFGFIDKFAPTKKTGGFWSGLGTIAKNIGLGVFAPQLLAGTKVGQVLDVYNTINRVNNLVNSLGITDINVIDSLKSNLTSPKSKKSTKTGPKDPPREGDEGGNEQNALLSEYILLLQRMEQGMLSAEEQGRFNSLKSRLGKAEGGIMDVNMNKGRLGETLYG